jgi:small-conductance mechanosensitive channel
MILTIPNGSMANMRLKNYARPNKNIRVKQFISVPFGADVSKVEKLLLEVLNEKEGVLDYPKPNILLSKATKDCLDFEMDFYINDYHDKYASQLKSDVLTEAYKSITGNDIKISNDAKIDKSVELKNKTANDVKLKTKKLRTKKAN